MGCYNTKYSTHIYTWQYMIGLYPNIQIEQLKSASTRYNIFSSDWSLKSINRDLFVFERFFIRRRSWHKGISVCEYVKTFCGAPNLLEIKIRKSCDLIIIGWWKVLHTVRYCKTSHRSSNLQEGFDITIQYTIIIKCAESGAIF
jgi:hypothetical protein